MPRPLLIVYSNIMFSKSLKKLSPRLAYKIIKEHSVATPATTPNISPNIAPKVHQAASGQQDKTEREASLALSAYMLIRYYKSRGHEEAELDPLRLVDFKQFGKVFAKNKLQFDLVNSNILVNKHLDEPFAFPSDTFFKQRVANFIEEKTHWTLREILHKLQNIYSNKIGLEFMYIHNVEERAWLMEHFEQLALQQTPKQQKTKILEDLTKVETFNYFLNDKLKTSKRFGVQGVDSLISALNKLVEVSAQKNVNYVGIGLAHRGRLSALVNVLGKSLQKIFSQFQQNIDREVSWGNSGDVKYHLGSTTQKEINGKKIRLSIMPNPSHLETVNPVVMGHVRAVQDALKNNQGSMAVIIHGDAAVAGQGIVYECLQMSYLDHYNINGTIHIVANNQIGFTTTPAQARSGLYCTNVARSIQAPVIHVNADQPQKVNQAIKMAVDYRLKFKKDIFIDIIGYRRYGHNQQDQPSFTQPMMYQNIAKRPTCYHLYAQKLTKEGVVSDEQVKELWGRQFSHINNAYAQSLKDTFDITKWRMPTYHSVVDYTKLGYIKRTGINRQLLTEIGKKVTFVPQTITLNPIIKKIYAQRQKAIQTGQGIDFALAQSLAFGSLLLDGFNIRFSGQDVQRGTFSHRHAVVVDQQNEKKYMPLRSLLPEQQHSRMQITNSFLSEYAALGYEYGYALTNPNTLTIWQAQFGDFANGAQIIIDNYLVAGQSKWNIQNGIVMNLPHGMDGQGPQHSSGRMERYLQMMNDSWVSLYTNGQFNVNQRALRQSNMAVICCSTASNLFHAMRRQMRRDYRKPLINFVNKKLLKLRQAGSSFAQINNDHFDTVIDDHSVNPQQVTKVVLLYGQAYYSALEKRTQLARKDVALVRVQQIAPLHYAGLQAIFKRYSNAKSFVWFQEQQRNSGAWNYVQPRISVLLEWLKKEGKVSTSVFECVSRKTSSSPAVGKKKKHDAQQIQILNKLFQQ